MAGRILVLDDEENYAQMLQELLREHNYRVDMATRPERAIAQLEEIPYDLIISDYKMPVMDGSDFLRRSRVLYPDLPFILVSGLMNTPELVKVANMSVTLVMEKPLDTEAFLRHVARFSSPQTEAEKSDLSGLDEDEVISVTYPAKPSYMCGDSLMSKRFLSDVWSKFKDSNYCFLLEPVGGEADLVLKDFSVWRGNDDRLVKTYSFDELVEGGALKLEALSSDQDVSHVAMVRLDSHSDIVAAKEFVAKQFNEDSDVFVAFIVSSSDCPKAFMDEVDGAGLVLPPLNMRPLDVAGYIRRFLRIATERLNKPAAGVLLPKAAYTLLAHDWGSCREIQEVIQALVANSDDAAISQSVVESELDVVAPPIAQGRMKTLLACAQKSYLNEALRYTELSPSALASSLKLDGDVQSKEDLISAPLVQINLV
ncbi:MAG: response regulator [Opitutaceae bacterium]